MASKNIQIKGSFDVSQILASFRKIRDEAAKSNVSDKLLGGYDKELEKVEKLITLITAALNRGLTDNLSIKEFSRLVGQLEKLFGILNVKAQGFADVANYKTESANLRKYTNQLEALIKKQDGLRKAAENYIDTNRKSLGINEKEAKLLKKAMADAEAYKKVVDDLVISKAKAAQQLATTESVKTKVGKEIVDNATGGNFEFGVAAKKSRDKSRENLAAKGLIDELKALAAALKEYQLTLRKTMEEGGTAKDALKSFIEVMLKYKLEVKNADEVLQQFQLDMDKIVDTAMNTTDTKGGLNRNIKRLVSTNQSLSLTAANLVNALPILDVVNGYKELAKVEGLIVQENEKIHNLNVLAAADLLKLNDTAKNTSKNVIDGLEAENKEAQKNVELLNAIKSGFDKIGQGAKLILSITTAWRSLRNVIKNTFNDVKNLDKSFANIAMVTEYSVKDMWELYDQYAEMANRLGQSTQSVVEASGLYYQQGLKTNEVLKLTEETMKLATLAGLDFKEATSQMTAALRAFHMDMSEGAHVTDVYAEVAAHAAVDVQGLSEAMSATAAIANSAGMSFENTTAMLATMVEATQEAPKNLGTAMKTILARFTELKTNVAGTAESEFDDLDYNKVDKALKSVGVSIKDATGLFRNMDDVLLELSSKWNGLDRNSLRYIATIAAGSRQQSRFIALMENYERTMELVNVALNSAGRSSQLFAKYLDTVEYRVNKIKNSWELFRTSLLDSDAYKGALDLFRGFLDKLNTTSVGGLTTLGITWLTVGRKAISSAMNGWSDMSSGLISGITNKLGGVNKLPDRETFKKDYVNKEENRIISEEYQVYDEEATNKAADKAYDEALKKAKKRGKLIGTILSTAIVTAATVGLTSDKPGQAFGTAFVASFTALIPTVVSIGKDMAEKTGKALTSGLKATGIGLAIAAITGAISWALSLFNKYKQEERELNVEYQILNLKKELDTINLDIENSKAKVKSYRDSEKSLKDIQKEYDELNSKVVLTSEELERYNSLIETLLNDYPELITYYDEENNKIKISNDLLEDKIQKVNKLKEAEAKTLLGQESLAIITELKIDEKTKQKDFLSLIENLLNGYGTRKTYNGYTLENKDYAKTVYGAFSANDFDVEKTIATLESTYGKYEQKELEEIKHILEASKDKLTSIDEHADEQYAANKEYADTIYADRSETERNIIAAMGVDLSSQYSKVKGSLSAKAKTTETESEFKDFLDTINHTFKDSKISDDIDDLVGAMDKMTDGWNTNDDYYAVAEKYGDVLEKYFGIKNEEDYKAFTSSGALEDDKAYAKASLKILENQLAEANNIDVEKYDTLIKGLSKELEEVNKNQSELTALEIKNKSEQLKREYAELGDYTNQLIDKTLDTNKINNYTNKLSRFGLLANETFANATGETIGAYDKIIDNLSKKFGEVIDDKQVGKALTNLTNFVNNSHLSKDIQKALLTFDPTSLDGKTREEAKETIESLLTNPDITGHLGEADAKAYAENFLLTLERSDLADFDIKDVLGLELKVDSVKESAKKVATAYKTAMDEVLKYIQNGYIEALDIDKFKDAIKDAKLNPDDYLFNDEKGNYGINYEVLIQDSQDLLANEEKIIEELREQTKEAIDQIDAELSILETLHARENKEKNILKILLALTDEKAALGLVTNFSHTDVPLSDDEYESVKKTLKDKRDALQKQYDDKEYWEKLKKEIAAYDAVFQNSNEKTRELLKQTKEAKEKAYDDWVEKNKAVVEALKSLAKAIENVTEKLKELKELIEGTNYKSSIDGMYNYTTAMDYWAKETERAKKKLEKAGSITEAKNNYLLYGEDLLKLKSLLTALNKVYQTAYNNFGNILKNDLDKFIKDLPESEKISYNIEDFITLDKTTGLYQINTNATNRPGKINEYIRKWFEDNGPKANEYFNKIKENNDKIEQLDEEFLEQLRKARDEYIDLQDLMIEVLREKYQQEIDDLQNKYDAMNEADNKYLESLQKNLDKQRKLRDLEKNWNDLTNKERKLSLMQRDTSGGNLADVKNLQEEIDDLRTLLLDDAVDLIIEKLTEFYELLKETRDAEIEYKLTLIDDVALLKEATEALEKILTSDDLVNWWKENVTGIEAFSEQKLTKLTEDWNKLFDAKSQYVASIDKTMLDSITETNGHLKDVSNEATHIVETTSEGITQLAEKSLEEAGNEYKEAVKKAKEALKDALDAVQKLQEALNKAIEAAEKAKTAFDDISKKFLSVLDQLNKNQTLYGNGKGLYMTYEQFVRYMQENLGKNYGGYKEEKVTLGAYDSVQKKANTPAPSTSVGTNWTLKKITVYVSDKTNTTKTSDEYSTYMGNNRGINTQEYKATSVEIPKDVDHGIIYKDGDKWKFLKKFSKKDDAQEYIEEHAPPSLAGLAAKDAYYKKYRAFAEGGLVNYTGPAWVDGSRSRPEAFLSSEDTRRIGEAARILADLPILSQPIKEQVPTTTIGDTTIQIDVHVDSIANDYDLDEAMNKVEQRIVNAAKYAGSNVILKKH